MAQQPTTDFEAVLEGRSSNYASIDFNENQLDGRDTLGVPEQTDDLEATARKLEALAQTVRQGKSLAVSTDFKLTVHQRRDALAVARERMNLTEIMQYDAWAGGVPIETFDWATCRREVPTSIRSASRFKRYVTAMQRIWKDFTPNEQNASWIMAHAAHLSPLITAMTKVIAAEKELTGGRPELSEMEAAELQTVHKITTTAMSNVNAMLAHIKMLTRSINYSREILQARENAIKSKK